MARCSRRRKNGSWWAVAAFDSCRQPPPLSHAAHASTGMGASRIRAAPAGDRRRNAKAEPAEMACRGLLAGGRGRTHDGPPPPARRGQKKNAQPVAVGRSIDRSNSVVRLAGIEPTTPWFVAKYSIQLSYSRQAQHYRQDFPAAAQVRHFFVAALWRIGARARGRGRRRDGWRSMGGQWAVSGRLIGDPLAAGACPILSLFLQ